MFNSFIVYWSGISQTIVHVFHAYMKTFAVFITFTDVFIDNYINLDY